jgi:hypothetical protein
MAVSAEGKVTWAAPANFADKELTVLLGVKDKGGETFQTFKLTVDTAK